MKKKLRKLDWFEDEFVFRLPDGKKSKKSWEGFVITMLAISVVIIYAGMQFIRLMQFGEPSIMVHERVSYFDDDFEFSADKGFMIAYALTAYDDNTESIEDPRYGQLKGYFRTWGLDDKRETTFTPLPFDFCSKEQLGLSQTSLNSPVVQREQDYTLFFKTHDKSINDIWFY